MVNVAEEGTDFALLGKGRESNNSIKCILGRNLHVIFCTLVYKRMQIIINPNVVRKVTINEFRERVLVGLIDCVQGRNDT